MNKIMVSRLDLLEMAKKIEDAETARTAVMMDVLNLVPPPEEKVNADTCDVNEGKVRDALEKVLNFNPEEVVQGTYEDFDEDYSNFFAHTEISYLMHVVENLAEDTSYLGEVFGIGDDTTGYYYLLQRNETFSAICEQKGLNRVGLIVDSELLSAILDKRVELQGYDFCGAHVDGQWQFYKCNESLSYMTFSTFGLITNLFSRNEGIFESSEMIEKYAIIVGCGSVGSYVALALARAGVGRFILIDGDVLQPHNNCRHQLGCKDWGRYKAEAMKDAILNVNPLAEIICFNGYLQDAPVDIFNLGHNGVMVGTADNRGGNAFANDLAVHLNIPFVAIGCWARAAAGEVFYWKPDSNMPTYREAYKDLISYDRPDSHQNYFGDESEQALLNFEPGTSIDIDDVTIKGIKMSLDLLNLDSANFTPRVINYLTNCTLICNTNNPAIGGENVAMFPHPLFISNTIHMRKRADDNGRYGTCASTAEEVENN